MTFKEFPKMIYIGGKGHIVNNKEEEEDLIGKSQTKAEEKPKGWGK